MDKRTTTVTSAAIANLSLQKHFLSITSTVLVKIKNVFMCMKNTQKKVTRYELISSNTLHKK